MGGGGQLPSRPFITFDGVSFKHNGNPCRVAMKRGRVSIGCSDITPEALSELLNKYNKHFSNEEVVIQY